MESPRTRTDVPPTVLRVQGFAFVIHLNDHLPAHVHVYRSEGRCRILIQDDIAMTHYEIMKGTDTRRALARQNVAFLRRKWEEIHGPLG
jgi:hypothetical protein